jgi:hypothetical protein
MHNEYILHIETAPLPTEELAAKAPVFKAAANLKDAQKIAEDIEKKKKKYFEEAAFNESTGFICAVCLKDTATGEVSILNSLANTEEKILSWLYNRLMPGETTVTFKGAEFVYPFLSRRGARYRIPFMTEVFYSPGILPAGYLDDERHTDIAAIWGCGGSQSTSLKEVADVLDISYTAPLQPYYKVLQESEKEANRQLNDTMTTLQAVYTKILVPQ